MTGGSRASANHVHAFFFFLQLLGNVLVIVLSHHFGKELRPSQAEFKLATMGILMASFVLFAVIAASAFYQVTPAEQFPCGVSKFRMTVKSNRIANGWEVAKHSLPWHVQLVVFDDARLKTGGQCGGSLIQLKPGNVSDLVLTAAHCVKDEKTFQLKPKELMFVTVGVHDITDPDKTRVGVADYTAGAFTHFGGENDIALLRLQKGIPYTDFTRPICLPKKDAKLPVGGECYVSGHGVMFLGGSTTKELRMVDVDVLSNEKCAQNMDADKKFNYETQFCAGTNDRTARNGDSGGPLVCKQDDRFVQYGIVSFGTADYRYLNRAGKYTFLPKFVEQLHTMEKKLKPAQGVLPVSEIHEYLTNLEKIQAQRNKSLSTGSLDTGSRRAPRPPVLRPEEYECGVSAPEYPVKMSVSARNRIANGWEAHKHSLPWMVLITASQSGSAAAQSCGGTLIQLKAGNRTDLVLTAAHCIVKNGREATPDNCKVLVGVHHQYAADAFDKEVRVKALRVHPQYDQENWGNDIAVVRLEKAVPYTAITRPVCLPQKGEQLTVGTECVVSGWGQTSQYSTMLESELRMATVKVADFDECIKDINVKVTSDQVVCAKTDERRGFCNGDSGGPLTCKKGNKWVQYGIVSFSATRCGSSFDKYAKVSSYVDWITQKDNELPVATSEFPYEKLVEYLTGLELINGPKSPTAAAAAPSSSSLPSLPSRPSVSSGLPSRPSASPTIRFPSAGSGITRRPAVFSRFLHHHHHH